MRNASLATRLGQGVVAIATALAILGVAILPFLTPAWVSFEQGRTGVQTLVNQCPHLALGCDGLTDQDVHAVTNAILRDLIVGPPDFDVDYPRGQLGRPVLSEGERAHMRDVRGVFAGFYLAALLSIAALAVALGRHRWRADAWPAVRAGAAGLVAALVVGGVIATVAFDTAFAVFHSLFFSPGSWTFDPTRDKLVQLFPDEFWSETTIAVGAVAFGIAAAVAFIAGRRMRASSSAAMAMPAGRSSVGAVG